METDRMRVGTTASASDVEELCCRSDYLDMLIEHGELEPLAAAQMPRVAAALEALLGSSHAIAAQVRV